MVARVTDETDVAVVWLKKEDWPQRQKIVLEPPAYEQWLTKAEGTIRAIGGRLAAGDRGCAGCVFLSLRQRTRERN